MYHKMIIIGNLGRDPEMRYLSDGTAVTSMNIATNDTWTDRDGQRQKRTIWWRVSVFGRSAEACNTYLKKGSQVYVEGTMTADNETGGPRVFTRQDGTTGASYEVRAREVKFLSGREGGGDASGSFHDDYPMPSNEDDIPF